MMIVTLVEVAIVSYAGIILLGFGGSSFTKDYAVKYLTYAVSVGIKIMMMTLVVSVGQSIMIAQAQNFKGDNINEIIVVIGVAVVFLAVTKALPSMLQSLVMGSSVGSNATLPAAVGTVAGAGAAAVGAMAGAVAVGHAAYKGGGSAGQMAGRAMGAVAGAAFDRVAGMPGSRMGSVIGNAASGLRQQNQQRQLQLNQPRSLTAPGSSGGGSPSSSAAQRASAARGAVRRRQEAALALRPYRIGIGFPRRGWATSHLPRRWWECCASARTSWVQPLPRPRDSPRRLPLHPNQEAKPYSPPQAEPRELLLSAMHRRLRSVAVHLLSLQTPARPPAQRSRPVTVPELPLRPSLPFQPRTAQGRLLKACLRLGRYNSSTTAARASASPGSEAVLDPLWSVASLHPGWSFGRSRPNHQPAGPRGDVQHGAARDRTWRSLRGCTVHHLRSWRAADDVARPVLQADQTNNAALKRHPPVGVFHVADVLA